MMKTSGQMPNEFFSLWSNTSQLMDFFFFCFWSLSFCIVVGPMHGIFYSFLEVLYVNPDFSGLFNFLVRVPSLILIKYLHKLFLRLLLFKISSCYYNVFHHLLKVIHVSPNFSGFPYLSSLSSCFQYISQLPRMLHFRLQKIAPM